MKDIIQRLQEFGARHMHSTCVDAIAEIKRLRARVAELETPDAYWSDIDDETARPDPHELLDYWSCSGDPALGATFWVDPLHKLPREWYAVVPGKRVPSREWADGGYAGGLDLSGPYDSEERARIVGARIVRERREEWEAWRQENCDWEDPA